MEINGIRYGYFNGHGHDTLIDYDGGAIFLSTLATRVKRPDCEQKWFDLYKLVNKEMICITNLEDNGTVHWLDEYGDQLTSKSSTIRTHAEQKPDSRWTKLAEALDRYIQGERKEFIPRDRTIKVVKFSDKRHAVVDENGSRIIVNLCREVEARNMDKRPMRWTPIYAALRKFVEIVEVRDGLIRFRVLNGNTVVDSTRSINNIDFWRMHGSQQESFERVWKAYRQHVLLTPVNCPVVATPEEAARLHNEGKGVGVYCKEDVENTKSLIETMNPCVEIPLGEAETCSLKPQEQTVSFVTTWDPDFKYDSSIVPQEFRRHWVKDRGMGTIVDGCLVALYLCAEGTYRGYCEELQGKNYELTIKSDYTVTDGNLPIYVVATGLPGRFALEDFDVRY